MFRNAKRNAAKKISTGNSKTERRKRLRLESLEARRLLAGNVGVDVVEGNLLIRGDRLSNGIEVRQLQDGSGAFVIRGLISEDGEVTTVNGEASVTVDGVTGNVQARMGAGDDVLYVHDADLPGICGRHRRRHRHRVASEDCHVATHRDQNHCHLNRSMPLWQTVI